MFVNSSLVLTTLQAHVMHETLNLGNKRVYYVFQSSIDYK